MPPRFDDFRGERWDRDRFERDRFERFGRPAPTAERDYVRFEEREKFPGRRDVLLDERHERRGPRGHFEERERYFEEDRYAAPPRRAATFLDEPIPAETSRQALAPYRKRPTFLRRQSSLDTFDRAPRREEYRLPSDVPIPLPIRRPASPPRGRYYEEIQERYHDSDDEYRDIRVKEERRGNHRSKSRMRSRSVRRRKRSVSSSSSSSSSDESSHKTTSVVGKKGRTKMPKRLANKAAVIELGYPFEEEDNFIIVMRALEKDHIDEIITKSKKYSSGDKSVTYKYEGKTDGPPPAAAPPRPAASVVAAPPAAAPAPAPAVAVATAPAPKPAAPAPVAVAVAPAAPAPAPPAPVVAAPKPAAPPAPAGGEIVKTTKTTTTVVEPPHDHHHRQDLAVVVPHQRGRRATDADIRREIERLERERRLLRNDREYEEDWEIVERRPRERTVHRVERDRKGRMALVRSAH